MKMAKDVPSLLMSLFALLFLIFAACDRSNAFSPTSYQRKSVCYAALYNSNHNEDIKVAEAWQKVDRNMNVNDEEALKVLQGISDSFKLLAEKGLPKPVGKREEIPQLVPKQVREAMAVEAPPVAHPLPVANPLSATTSSSSTVLQQNPPKPDFKDPSIVSLPAPLASAETDDSSSGDSSYFDSLKASYTPASGSPQKATVSPFGNGKSQSRAPPSSASGEGSYLDSLRQQPAASISSPPIYALSVPKPSISNASVGEKKVSSYLHSLMNSFSPASEAPPKKATFSPFGTGKQKSTSASRFSSRRNSMGGGSYLEALVEQPVRSIFSSSYHKAAPTPPSTSIPSPDTRPAVSSSTQPPSKSLSPPASSSRDQDIKPQRSNMPGSYPDNSSIIRKEDNLPAVNASTGSSLKPAPRGASSALSPAAVNNAVQESSSHPYSAVQDKPFIASKSKSVKTRVDVDFSFGLIHRKSEPLFDRYMQAVEDVVQNALRKNTQINNGVTYDPNHRPFVSAVQKDGKQADQTVVSNIGWR
jgi:hypothetical protein